MDAIRLPAGSPALALCTLGLLCSGCLAKSEPTRLPNGARGIRVECNYDISNCRRKARDVCHGDYHVVDEGDLSCADCGWDLPEHASNESNVFKGTLYVQCDDP